MYEDYIFHYKLDKESSPQLADKPAQLVRNILIELLNLVNLLEGDNEVKVDGFKFLNNHARRYEVGSEAPENILDLTSRASLDPRVTLIKKITESLLSLVEFEHNGEVVSIDGFKLKDLHDWLVPSSGDPREIFDYAGTLCNCDCVFCCNAGNKFKRPANERTFEDQWKEISTRVEYFSKHATLYAGAGSVYEVTIYPYFIRTLKQLREKTDKPFRINTNGTTLTTHYVSELEKLKPLYLHISLNSSSLMRRARLMRDMQPEIAINSLRLLREAKIPYAVVIVPWPITTIDEMLEDLTKTVEYSDSNSANLIQVNLPGFTRSSEGFNGYNSNQVWQHIIRHLRELRETSESPIVLMPSLYEENIYQGKKNLPQVIGLIKNSPAYHSGMKKGDIILQINGISINSRPQARDLLQSINQYTLSEISLLVKRGSAIVEVPIVKTVYSYPYCRETDSHLGIIFIGGAGFRISYLEEIKQMIHKRQSTHTLFLTSTLVKPIFQDAIKSSGFIGESLQNLAIEVPSNNYFGGNIIMGDLLVVQDLIDHIKKHIIEKGKPDLVIIPRSPFALSGWGRDLTGRVYLDIERETHVPVELLKCATVYD